MNNITWWHRIQLSDGTYTPGKVVHGPDGGDWPTTRFGLPNDLTGKTVLDIGTFDGFFAFEAEKRGAALVFGVDCTVEEGGQGYGTAGFQYARKNLNSRVIYYTHSIQNKLPENMKCDIALFYGVLYHLKNPLTGLENACDITKDTLLIETAISVNDDKPSLEYRPGFDNDPTNYFYPNVEWIKKVCSDKGFNKVEVIYNDGIRATLRADRT